MTPILLDIVEHTDGSGSAAIRVTGLDALPPDPSFRIDPIDDGLSSRSGSDWPSGPRRPVAVVPQDGTTVDLLLGPDVLDSPLLLPGTPVTVSIRDTPAVAELVWPALTVRSPARKRPVVVTDELLAAQASATDAKRAAAAAALAAATALAASVSRADDLASVASNGIGSTGSADQRRRRTLPPLPTPVASEPPAAGEAAPAATVDKSAAGGGTASPEADRARALSGFRPVLAATPGQLVVREDKHFGLTTSPTGTAVARIPPPAARGPSLIRQAAAFVAGMAAAALLVYGATNSRLINLGPGHAGARQPDVAVAAARSTTSLRAVLTTAGVSPRGRSAAGVSGDAALVFADRYLHGSDGLPKDQGEASFWLRHGLSQALDHTAMKWALTQLGTIYAAPEGFEPDYAKARLVWEIAGAMGDPVALCFNAELYAQGLGVPRHVELARTLYDRARNAGGCEGLDAAVARLK